MLGFAVPEIEASLRKTKRPYEEISREPLIVNERQKVRELFVPNGATTIELLEPLGEGSPLHLALEVTDLEAAIARGNCGARTVGRRRSGRGLQ